MKRVLLLVAVLSVFMHVGVAYASGPVGSVPPPQYPNWGCTGTCNSANGDWSLTAGSSMVTNVASLYSNENVVIDVNDLVVPSNACIDITVDTLHICTSSNGIYPWTFSNVSGSYHQIQIFCSTSCQGNYLVSVLPISAPSPTPTPNPSFTATPTPLVPPTVTPPSVPRITHTPTVSPTPCVIDAWGCDQPATATYVACESGIVANFGTDPCASPTVSPTPTTGAGTPTAVGGSRDCGLLHNCNFAGGSYVPGVSATFASPWYRLSNYAACSQAACSFPWVNEVSQGGTADSNDGFFDGISDQFITTPSSGYVCVAFAVTGGAGSGSSVKVGFSSSTTADYSYGQSTVSNPSSGTFTYLVCSNSLISGTSVSVEFWRVGNLQGGHVDLNINNSYMSPDVSGSTATRTPTPNATLSPVPTWTPRPTFSPTPMLTPTPLPSGFVPPTATILANIDTCLGTIQDCNLALTPIAGKIGGIPGLIATPMAPLNTSVFSPFQTIGITRGGCLSFGKIPVVVPHILWLASPVPVRGGPTATPNISGYVPISVTWTLPTVVGTPMRQGNFGPIDPIEFEPCNDPAFPTWGWDLSWNASTFFEWVGFFVWTIALIRRIFG